MHEERTGLESGDGTQSAAFVLTPDRPRVSAASEDVVARLRSSLGGDRVPITVNIARQAAMSAAALARRPLRLARMTPAQYPALSVPSGEATWQPPPPQQQRPVPYLRQTPQRAVGPTVVEAPSPVPVSMRTSGLLDVEAGLGIAMPLDSAHESTLAFNFRPGERVLPRFSAGHEAVGADSGLTTAEGQLTARRPVSTVSGYLRTTARWVAMMFAGWFTLMFALILLFRFVDPPGSTLILWQAVTGMQIEQRWVPLSRISNNLKRAVVVSEDGRFCRHWGIDPREILAAIRRARHGVPRGASTITMQVAKNLFLWPSKSYVRKGLEVPLALSLELLWPKWRIMEVYLNIAEWGPGVFGVEAAAQYHFRKLASRLSPSEAALLAVALPNPIERRAGKPGRGTARLASFIQSRVRVSGDAAACVLTSR